MLLVYEKHLLLIAAIAIYSIQLSSFIRNSYVQLIS